MNKHVRQDVVLAAGIALIVSGAVTVTRLTAQMTEGSVSSPAPAQTSTATDPAMQPAYTPPPPPPMTQPSGQGQSGIVCTVQDDQGTVRCLRDGREEVAVPPDARCTGGVGATCTFGGSASYNGPAPQYGQQSGVPSGQPSWEQHGPSDGQNHYGPGPQDGSYGPQGPSGPWNQGHESYGQGYQVPMNDGRDAQGNYQVPSDQIERYKREARGPFCIVNGSTRWAYLDSPDCQGSTQVFGSKDSMGGGMGHGPMGGMYSGHQGPDSFGMTRCGPDGCADQWPPSGPGPMMGHRGPMMGMPQGIGAGMMMGGPGMGPGGMPGMMMGAGMMGQGVPRMMGPMGGGMDRGFHGGPRGGSKGHNPAKMLQKLMKERARAEQQALKYNQRADKAEQQIAEQDVLLTKTTDEYKRNRIEDKIDQLTMKAERYRDQADHAEERTEELTSAIEMMEEEMADSGDMQ